MLTVVVPVAESSKVTSLPLAKLLGVQLAVVVSQLPLVAPLQILEQGGGTTKRMAAVEGPRVKPPASRIAPEAMLMLCWKLVARVTSVPVLLAWMTLRPTGTAAAHSPPAGNVKFAFCAEMVRKPPVPVSAARRAGEA